ncbi:MAG: radical SAM protein [Candidatus Diapherotrites archaeon]
MAFLAGKMVMRDLRMAVRKVYSGDLMGELGDETFTVSVNAKMDRVKAEAFVKRLLKAGEKPVRVVMSLCPGCVEAKQWDKMAIPALLLEKHGEILMRKRCQVHGETEEKYWESADCFYKAMMFADSGISLESFQIQKAPDNVFCPIDCGLCAKHKSHTALANIAVTNRCDLACWYCFFFQKWQEPVYEPSLEQIRKMLRVLRSQKPVPPNAIQLTGGEPTLREDILEIIKLCKKEGFEHVQFNTNGVRFARDPSFVKELVIAGANVIYLSFDGVSPKTNPKNYYEVPKALENVRSANFAGIVLVPTVINGQNSQELGDIIRYAAANIDVVRGVNFQPVSLVGMMPKSERRKQRITIPKTLKLIEEQTNGQIAVKDFYTVPSVAAITDFIEALSGIPQYRFSTHFVCGMATYVFVDGKRFVPITRFVDVDGLFEYLRKLSIEFRNKRKSKLNKFLAGGKLLYHIDSFIDREAQPTSLDLGKILARAITSGSYDGLKDFHYKSLFVGMMHFQDPYNYDLDRVERCCIHYAMPDGRIIPFCAYNVIPDLYRDKTNRKYSISAEEWEKKHGKKLEGDKYQRKVSEKEKMEVHAHYKEMIEKFK